MFASFNISFFAMLVGISLVISFISQMNLTRIMVAAFRHPYATIAWNVSISLVGLGLWIWAFTFDATSTTSAFVVIMIVEYCISYFRRDAIAEAMQVAIHSV